ncbi:hypothetical protein BDQ17DRAFT_1343824 [Cyathus striatus]|nr:hypothetical protein BDQ17DRAFT_1343824 [Cyathus striatus]
MPSKPYISSTLEKDSSSLAPSSPTSPDTAPATEQPNDAIPEAESQAGEDSAGEGATSGAYNPVTGEINWDCPCLGGMAHGPCGQQFRDAFSCFVFSEEEPKGIDCVEKFKAMQNCFREHPDVYGDDDDDDELPTIDDPAPSELKPDSATLASPTTSPKESSPLELSSTSSS